VTETIIDSNGRTVKRFMFMH